MSAYTRAEVFKDTQRIGSKTDTDKIEVVEFTCKAREDPEPKPKTTRSLARVYNMDPLDVARECAMTGYNVAMLTEINENFPVSGMTKGGMQGPESEVLLRSNYCRRINDNYYPLKRRHLTYASGLVVHKDKIYELYQKSFSVAMIGSTIVRSPTMHSKQENGVPIQGYANRSEEELMRDTINSVFQLAQTKGHDTLVLPAIGCEQGHPTDAVIGFYNDAMKRFDIKYVFYAIKSYIDHKPRCKLFAAFHKGIERKYVNVPSLQAPMKEVSGKKAGGNKTEKPTKKLSKVEKELQEEADGLLDETLDEPATGATEDMSWLEEIADEIATEQENLGIVGEVGESEPDPKPEPEKSKSVPKKKTGKKVNIKASK